MKHYKIIVTHTAELEISECLGFIAGDSVENAINWHNTLYAKLQTLKVMPGRCPIADETVYFDFKVYCLLVNGYRALYRIHQDTVEILHVKSPKQNR